MQWWSNIWVRVTVVAVAVALLAIAAVVATSDDDDPRTSTVPTSTPINAVARALSGPTAAVADPQVIRAIRDATSCVELEEMASSAQVAAERFGSDDRRQANAVLYLTESERQLEARGCRQAAPAG